MLFITVLYENKYMTFDNNIILYDVKTIIILIGMHGFGALVESSWWLNFCSSWK